MNPIRFINSPKCETCHGFKQVLVSYPEGDDYFEDCPACITSQKALTI